MTKFVALSRQRHAGMTWNRPRNYGFSADRQFVGIASPELAPAATTMPLAFVKEGEFLHLVGLLSWNAGGNLFVGLDGQWMTSAYIPALFRTHPFRLLRQTDEKLALGIDEESGLVLEKGGEELFFDDKGQPSSSVSEVLRILETLEKSRSDTALAIAALNAAKVIVPWKSKPADDENKEASDVLFKIDEARLRNLGDDAFLKLRKAGGLSIAYAQLISLSRLGVLARLAEYRSKERAVAPQNSTLANILAQGSGDTLRFD